MLAAKSPYIQSAYEQLQLISQDKTKRLEYEACEKAIRDHNQLKYEAEERGVQQGIQQGKLEIAMKLYHQGWQIEHISEIVGVSTEVLEEKLAK